MERLKGWTDRRRRVVFFEKVALFVYLQFLCSAIGLGIRISGCCVNSIPVLFLFD